MNGGSRQKVLSRRNTIFNWRFFRAFVIARDLRTTSRRASLADKHSKFGYENIKNAPFDQLNDEPTKSVHIVKHDRRKLRQHQRYQIARAGEIKSAKNSFCLYAFFEFASGGCDEVSVSISDESDKVRLRTSQ